MRETRSSGSAEGVIGNCDPYSDSPEAMVVKQPKFTRVGEPTLLCNHVVGDERARAAMLADVPVGESPIGGSAQLPP